MPKMLYNESMILSLYTIPTLVLPGRNYLRQSHDETIALSREITIAREK